jgi:hypothetical protein
MQIVNEMRQYIGAVIAERNILSTLCLFVNTSPNNKAETEIRIFHKNDKFKYKNPRSPQSQASMQRYYTSSRPPSYFVSTVSILKLLTYPCRRRSRPCRRRIRLGRHQSRPGPLGIRRGCQNLQTKIAMLRKILSTTSVADP